MSVCTKLLGTKYGFIILLSLTSIIKVVSHGHAFSILFTVARRGSGYFTIDFCAPGHT